MSTKTLKDIPDGDIIANSGCGKKDQVIYKEEVREGREGGRGASFLMDMVFR